MSDNRVREIEGELRVARQARTDGEPGATERVAALLLEHGNLEIEAYS